jgi:hypothetical protein
MFVSDQHSDVKSNNSPVFIALALKDPEFSSQRERAAKAFTAAAHATDYEKFLAAAWVSCDMIEGWAKSLQSASETEKDLRDQCDRLKATCARQRWILNS